MLGKEWVDSHFNGMQSPPYVLYLESLWRDWLAVENLIGSDQLLSSWRGGQRYSAQTELRVFARLARQGIKVELYPKVDGNTQDCRFRVDGRWVYVEISRREISQIRKKGFDALTRITTVLTTAARGRHGRIDFLKVPEEDELDEILSWLSGLQNIERVQLRDLAIFWTEPLEDEEGDNISIVNPPARRPATKIRMPQGGRYGIASITIVDQAAQEVLEREAAQLSPKYPGVVCLDLSSIIGGPSEWVSLIQRRLQPQINRRISGVLLFQQYIHISEGPQLDGQFIINSYARKSLTSGEINILENVI